MADSICLMTSVSLSVVKEIVLTITPIAAVCIGYKGLDTWRKQLKGNTEYTLAKSALTCLYELRACIGVARNSFGFSSEPNLPQEQLEKMNHQLRNWHAARQTYEKRWEPVSAAMSKLEVLLFEIEAVWGHEKVAEFKKLRAVVFELRWAMEDDLENRNPELNRQELDRDEQNKIRRVLYRGSPKNRDEYNEKLEEAISKVETFLKPHISEHHL